MMAAVQPLSVEGRPSQARDAVSGSQRRAFGLGALAGFVGAGLAVAVFSRGDTPVVAQTRFLFLDSRNVLHVENAALIPGRTVKHERPLLFESKPWELRFDNFYGTIMYDPKELLYKCWYSPFTFSSTPQSSRGMSLEQRQQTKYKSGKGRTMSICYATSKDGIEWEKPSLQLVEFEGSKDNNIVWEGPHGAGVYYDVSDRPERRYKMLMLLDGKLQTALSADGLIWTDVRPAGVEAAGDTHNSLFWDPAERVYVGITRTWQRTWNPEAGRWDRIRQVARLVSADFVKWEGPTAVVEAMVEDRQPYSMPVFRHAGVYIGIVAVHQQPGSGVLSDRVWPELAWSPDSRTWHRIAEGMPLIAPSDSPSESLGVPLEQRLGDASYDFGCIYTCASPLILKDQIRIYYGASDFHHFGWREGSLALAYLRPDGFAGYRVLDVMRPGKVITSRMSYNGQKVQVSADVEPDGGIEVAALDDTGTAVARADAITATCTDLTVVWDQELNHGHLQLRFTIQNATIYSFSFAADEEIRESVDAGVPATP